MLLINVVVDTYVKRVRGVDEKMWGKNMRKVDEGNEKKRMHAQCLEL